MDHTYGNIFRHCHASSGPWYAPRFYYDPSQKIYTPT